MDRVLDALSPLVDLLGHADDPSGFAAELLEAARSTTPGMSAEPLRRVCRAHRAEPALIDPVLHAAGLIDTLAATASVSAAAAEQAAAARALLAQGAAEHWQLALTIPGFLRARWNALTGTLGADAQARETATALTDVASGARHRLIIAAPYLHAGFVRFLVEPVVGLLSAGGEVLVLTRALSLRAPRTSTANVEAVTMLREASDTAAAALGRPPRLQVCSWEEHGLGLHLKAVVADARHAYLGSSNLTPGGALGHAEVGVLLHSPHVATLDAWLRAIADELDTRRLPAAPARR